MIPIVILCLFVVAWAIMDSKFREVLVSFVAVAFLFTIGAVLFT